jgi:hypothetical protein
MQHTLLAGICGVGTTLRVITTFQAGLAIIVRIKDLLGAILGILHQVK